MDLRVSDTFKAQIQSAIDNKTKPLGSLGRIEALASQIAGLKETLTPEMKTCRLTIFAADHGIAKEGVSAFPQEVTRQMAANFVAGGAAANVFANTVGASVQVVDSGIAGEPMRLEGLINRNVAPGTRNFLREPAMTDAEYQKAFDAGFVIGAEDGWDAVCFGEMGIGNTSAATMLGHKIAGLPLDLMTGRGTGLDDQALKEKQRILEQASKRTSDILSPQEALIEYGGFEVVMMAGAMIGAATTRRLVIVDGFIATAAALAAISLEPQIKNAMAFAHKSAEAGHLALTNHLQVKPLLDLEMRLGEGTGALLAWPLAQAAANMLSDMASFESAGVNGPQE